MESVDWARNKCPLSAIMGVRISGLFIERFCDTRISSRENIRAFNKIWFIGLSYQSNHYNEEGHYSGNTHFKTLVRVLLQMRKDERKTSNLKSVVHTIYVYTQCNKSCVTCLP